MRPTSISGTPDFRYFRFPIRPMSDVWCPLYHMLFQSTEAATERAMKEAQCDHLRAAVLFIKELEVARVRLEGMLGSTTISDVVEALRFFVTVRSCADILMFSCFHVFRSSF